MQKLTVPIAKALANQAIAKIKEVYVTAEKKAKDSYKESKEWKAYIKANAVVQKAIKERQKAEQILKDKFSAKTHYISTIYGYDDEGRSYASFASKRVDINAEELKDRILVEHYTSTEGETSAQIIDRVVNEYTK